jgi:RimJ/RimL family protein N-acetyltransferase
MLRGPEGRFLGLGEPLRSRPSVRLRPYGEADRWLTAAIEGDDEMMQELGGALPIAEVERIHQRRLDAIAADRLRYFAVVVEPDAQVAGTICLWSDTVDGQRRSEAGWAILPAFQGRGIATEALRLLLEQARDEPRWGDIHAFSGTTNEPSNALCRSAGFTRVGEETVSYAGRHLRCNHWVLRVG